MGFNPFKKDGGVPDVGQEEKFDRENSEKKVAKKEDSDEKLIKKVIEKREKPPLLIPKETIKSKKPVKSTIANETSKLELDRINTKIEAMNAFIKGFNERFSAVSQQIGELRTMNLNTEKTVSKAVKAGAMASDIVKEVKPDQLRADYQKAMMKVTALSEKLATNRQFSETIIHEIKDLRKKAGIFLGTDALLKLNEDIKEDLIDLQKVSARVRLNAEKSEQIFVELKRGFAENQKLSQVISNLDTSYSGVREEVSKLKVDYGNIIKQKDFLDYKKTVDNKFLSVENSFLRMNEIEENNNRLAVLLEETFGLSKRNETEIGNIAVTIGDDRIKKVSDYENQLNSVLGIIDSMAGQISDIKKQMGMGKGKIPIEKPKRKVIGKDTLNLRNIEVHPEVKENLLGDKINKLGGEVEKLSKVSKPIKDKSVKQIVKKKLDKKKNKVVSKNPDKKKKFVKKDEVAKNSIDKSLEKPMEDYKVDDKNLVEDPIKRGTIDSEKKALEGVEAPLEKKGLLDKAKSVAGGLFSKFKKEDN